MSYSRVLNWDVRLVTWAAGLVGTPFEWGKTDCASLVRGCIAAMYGHDFFSYRYQSERGALKALATGGAVSDHILTLGADLYPFPFAQQGDVVVAPDDNGPWGEFAHVVIANLAFSSDPVAGVYAQKLQALKFPEGTQVYRLPWEIDA